jgi:hypothetical protein
VHPRGRGGRGQRLLYFFRTPPAIRVGRGAIDEEAIRLIEEHNPEVQFDWLRILKQAPEIKSSDAESAPRGRGGDRAPDDRPRGGDRRAAQPPRRLPDAPPPVPAAVPDDLPPANEVEDNRETAVFQRLGPEALARVRARYAEIKARIAEHQMDEAQREQLCDTAERLNPDGWVTAADVNEGLEQYEAVYESIRAVVGHGRKRRI